jgi:hypothetical protein
MWIGQAGVASLDQLARRFWPGKRPGTASDRLRRLVQAGYLEMQVWDGRQPGERIFALTHKGYMQLGSASREQLHVGFPAPAGITQQLLAQDAYLWLEAQVRERAGQLTSWKSERELRAEFLRAEHIARRSGKLTSSVEIPDAQATIMTAQGEEQILYIEIDGAYYGKMLWQKAKGLAKSGQQVLWVCTKARANYVRKAVAEYPNIQVLSI